MHDVIVVGGGVIGLSIAWELAIEGQSVLVLDRGTPQDAASWAAAGMLAPQSEAAGPDSFFHLCVASLRMYRDWATRLRDETGIDPEYSDSGLLLLASSEEALCRLKRGIEWQSAAGLTAELLTAEEACRLEPQLTLPLTGAVLMRGEHHVTPRRLLDALRVAATANGVEIRAGVRVEEVLSRGSRVEGVRTTMESIPARCVVIASGVWSPGIAGLQPRIPVNPRKGQILSLATRGAGFKRMIRWEHVYFVPRSNGELIVGATNEDTGFDRSITTAGVGRLLTEAQQVSSHVGGYGINEMWTGLRPATPDALPVIGKASIEGLVYATGHYRNGILLAPITASSVACLIENRAAPVPLELYAPSRFEV